MLRVAAGRERRYAQPRDGAAREGERVGIVFGVVVGHSGTAAMHVRAAERFGVDILARRSAHQRRAAEEHAALIAHDDGMIGHGGYIRAARRARSVHHRDLRNALRREPRLIEEYPAEVIAVGKHLVLLRQERTAALDEVNARQGVLAGNLLRAQMLLHRERVIRSALHGRVVGNDHAGAARDPADTGHQARARQARRRKPRAPPARRVPGTAIRDRAVRRSGPAPADFPPPYACPAPRHCRRARCAAAAPAAPSPGIASQHDWPRIRPIEGLVWRRSWPWVSGSCDWHCCRASGNIVGQSDYPTILGLLTMGF